MDKSWYCSFENNNGVLNEYNCKTLEQIINKVMIQNGFKKPISLF